MKQALADALEQRGYQTLTPVQVAVSAPNLTGADMLVSAQTGSGKTVGFGLAIAPAVLADADAFGHAEAPLALVIAPTRELALQVKRELAWLYAGAGVVMASCVGGMDMRDERRALARGAHIVVATPGRLRDHITRGSMDMTALRAVVLDEADEMLDLGFREDLEFILGEAPQDRQTLLFSATVPSAIVKLAQRYQRDAVRVSTKAEKAQHVDIEYRALDVSARDGEAAIINVLRYHEAPNALVFCNTRATVNRLTTRLSNRGFLVVALSGELSQAERTHALQAMRDGRARVCVATDVAARGIDLPKLDLVIHAELPSNHETLLHRSGRTGRAGRKGTSVLIVPPSTRKKAQRLLGTAKLSAVWDVAPSAEMVRTRDTERMLADETWSEPIADSEAETVERLVGGFTAAQLAAAYLRSWSARHSAAEELSPADAGPAVRAPFGPASWFAIEGGRATGDEPRRILPKLCNAGGLTREDVGAIRMTARQSLVQVREGAVETFLAAIGPDMQLEGVSVSRSEGPPSSSDYTRRDPTAPQDASRSEMTPAPVRNVKKPARPGKGSSPKSAGRPDNTAPSKKAKSPKTLEKAAGKAKGRHKPTDGKGQSRPGKS